MLWRWKYLNILITIIITAVHSDYCDYTVPFWHVLNDKISCGLWKIESNSSAPQEHARRTWFWANQAMAQGWWCWMASALFSPVILGRMEIPVLFINQFSIQWVCGMPWLSFCCGTARLLAGTGHAITPVTAQEFLQQCRNRECIKETAKSTLIPVVRSNVIAPYRTLP